MNELLLGRRLGLISSATFQRVKYEQLLKALVPDDQVQFSRLRQQPNPGTTQRDLISGTTTSTSPLAHGAGVNVLAVDNQTGRYLITGGADSAIRIWDLKALDGSERAHTTPSLEHGPAASITSSKPNAHTHALTSLSIYPFDPIPSTILTTAYDKTLKLFSCDAATILPVHTFKLTDTPHGHDLQQRPSSPGLVAVGTRHPTIQLLDLRSGSAVHSLPGHQGAVYSVRWSPISDHLLASGSADGRVLFFDVRRAQSAFASLDHEDAIGVLHDDNDALVPDHIPRPALDWSSKAHDGPVTGVRWFDGDAGVCQDARKLITCGHDQRIRVWDSRTGRNDLVHFGPRIRNQRNGEFAPLISPAACSPPGKSTVFWPNDDNKGEIFVLDATNGTLLDVLRNKTPATEIEASSSSSSSRRSHHHRRPHSSSFHTNHRAKVNTPSHIYGDGQNTNTTVANNRSGRINALAWRFNAHCTGSHHPHHSSSIIELYAGHGDGSIRRWISRPLEDEDGEDEDLDPGVYAGAKEGEEGAAQRKRKRKLEMLDGVVEGLVGLRQG